MIFRTLWTMYVRWRNRRARSAWRSTRITYTWNDERRWQDLFNQSERRNRQS